jgi:tetratricopeptide (TPR) repeat protein
MRMFLTILAAILLANPSIAAPGGGSFPQTVAPSKDAALEADYAQAEYLIKSDKCDEAISFLDKVVAKNAKHSDALNYLGYCHRKAGRLDVAKGYYDRALAADPNHLGAHEYLGELYLMLKDLPKAEAQLAKLKSLCPTSCTQLEDLEDSISTYKAQKR